MKLPDMLAELRLAWSLENHEALAAEAARKEWTPLQFFQHVMEVSVIAVIDGLTLGINEGRC